MDDIQSWWEVPSIAHFCSLFRVAFNLLDFDIEELEEALLTDGAEDSGSSLLQELIVRLLRGCISNNGISTFNYQMFLRRLFRQKCREYDMPNPFDSDIDFQFLPLRTKVEILHALCDFRLDADDVLDVLKNLDSDSLRVLPLGYDDNHSAYWYFYGTRLYREDYSKAQTQKKKKKKGRDRDKHRSKKRKNKKEDSESSSSSSETEELEMGIGEWQVVCYTESDWERLALKMEDSKSKVERALHSVLAEDFLPEIPRLFEEKERLQRKRLMEMQPRRQSTRIEKLKHQKEEERLKQIQLERQGRLERRRVEEEKRLEKKQKEEVEEELRKERAKENRAVRAMMRSHSSSDGECSSIDGGSSSNVESSSGKPKGRQTNNSLSSATGQIIIQPSRQKLRTSQVFRQSVEDLRTGLYKILDRIKNHSDAWPFLDAVEEEYAPRYYTVIAKPMFLQRMEYKLDHGEYQTFGEFKADFQLIVDNCRQYNGSDNEYTEMVGKLQKVFEAAVDRYLEAELSSDEEVAVEFQGEKAGISRKKGSLTNAPAKTISEPRTPSESIAHSRSIESDNDIDNERNALLGDRDSSDDADLSQDSDMVARKYNNSNKSSNKKSSSVSKPKKMGILKDPDAIEALERATEQTLKDINRWLDDTPRFSEFSSASNSPSQLMISDDCDLSSRIEADYRQRLKLDRPQKPRNDRDIHRRRLMKDQSLLKRKREIHRTIDRLQPGKSKGNLLSNLTAMKNNDEASSTKVVKSVVADKADESAPKLSLGTVLTNDVIGFGKHSFGGDLSNDGSSLNRKDTDSIEDVLESKPTLIEELDKKSLPEEDIKLEDSCDTITPEKKVKTETTIKEEEEEPVVIDAEKKEKKIVPSENFQTSKQEKVTLNYNVWYKAFGAPKSQPTSKKKSDLTVLSEDLTSKDSPKSVTEPIKHTKDEEILEEDKEKKNNLVPLPLQSPAKRQRKASTGSSVSERSSFSQDPMDPLADGSSPRPSLDEPYLSPQSEPMKTPYHHSPINGTIKVGFYQDTSFPRSNSSSSPRDPPSCSPRDPPSCSPRDPPSCSPRDLPNCSPREPISSPKSDYHPTYPPSVTVPNYSSPSVSSATPMYEPALSPYPAHMPYYDTSKSLTEQYRSTTQQPPSPEASPSPQPIMSTPAASPIRVPSPIAPIAHIEKPTTAVFPVKKRIYNDVGSLQQTITTGQDLSARTVTTTITTPTGFRSGGPFTPIRSTVEPDRDSRGFTPTPGRIPNQPAASIRHGFSTETGLPPHMGLAHHALPPYPYSDERLLSNPYFSSDSIYGKTAQVTTNSIPLQMFSQSGNVTTTSSYTKDTVTLSHFPPRPELTEVNISPNYNPRGVSNLTYPSPRPVGKSSSEKISSSFVSSVPLTKSKSPSALNYSSRSSEIMSSDSGNEPSPINFSSNSSDLHSNKVSTSSALNYFGRTSQDIIQPTAKQLKYTAKLNTPDILSNKVSTSSPISYVSNRAVADMLPSKVNSPYGRAVSDLTSSTGINYSANPDLVSNKLNVPSPLSYSAAAAQVQSDILSGKMNYPNHPSVTDLMQSQSRYNYTMSDLIQQSKGYPVSELMQAAAASKSNPSSYVSRSVGELLSAQNVYNYPSAVPRSTPNAATSKPVDTLKSSVAGGINNSSTKKQSKKSKKSLASSSLPPGSSSGTAESSTGFQHYSSPEAIALKTASVVPGSAFNFGPAPPQLKDTYTTYLDDVRSAASGYFVPHPETSGNKSSSSSSPHPPTSPFPFLGTSSRPPTYNPFINNPYPQYLTARHPEELIPSSMVLHPQGLLPTAGYSQSYLRMHDPINRPPWI